MNHSQPRLSKDSGSSAAEPTDKKDKKNKKESLPPPQQQIARQSSFLTAPEGGWLHNQFALRFGEGVYYSFTVTYLGRQQLAQSLRSIEFPLRNKVTQEAISRVREASRTRAAQEHEVPKVCRKFLDPHKPEVKMERIVLNISAEGIVLATIQEDGVLAHHRMTTISFACGGDYEDYDMIAYVAKSRLGRMCYVFDCGDNSNQVLATIGQAFVSASQQMEEEVEAEDFANLETELDEWEQVAQQFGDVLTDREYEALYGTSRRSAGAYEDSNYHEMEGRPDGGRSSYATLRSDDLPRSRRTSGGRYHTLQRGENGDRPYEDAPSRDYHSYERVKGEGNYARAASMDIEANPNYYDVTVDPEDDVEYDLAAEAGGASRKLKITEIDGKKKNKGRRPVNPTQYDLAAGTKDGTKYELAAVKESDYYEVRASSDAADYARAAPEAKAASGEASHYQEANFGTNLEANPNYHEVSAEPEPATNPDYHEYSVSGLEQRLYDVSEKPEATYDYVKQQSLKSRDYDYAARSVKGQAEDEATYDVARFKASVTGKEGEAVYASRSPAESIYGQVGRKQDKPAAAAAAAATAAAPPQQQQPAKKKAGVFGGLFQRKDNPPSSATAASKPAAPKPASKNIRSSPTLERDNSDTSDGGFFGPASGAVGVDGKPAAGGGDEGNYTKVKLAEEASAAAAGGASPELPNYSTVKIKGEPVNEELMGSIRAKPLQGRGDLLVRKLNQQNGTLTRTPAGGEQKRAAIPPQWNYIDPKLIAKSKET